MGSLRLPALGLVAEVTELRKEVNRLHRAAHNFLVGPLDMAQDFYSFREMLDFVGNNGLTHLLNISVSSMLTHFPLD